MTNASSHRPPPLDTESEKNHGYESIVHALASCGNVTLFVFPLTARYLVDNWNCQSVDPSGEGMG